MLFPNHQDSLRSRAIPDHAAEAAGISSATPTEVAAALGLNHTKSGGMLIPYIDFHGNSVTGADGLDLVRVRMDQGTPKYLSRSGSGYSVYLPPMIRTQLAAAARGGLTRIAAPMMVITEGEFKALSIEHNLSIPSIGLAGVNMYWSPDRDKTEPATAATPLHPDLVAILQRCGGVVVIADSDAAEKAQVRAAMRLLKDAISEQFKITCAYMEVPAPKKGRGRPKKDVLGMDADNENITAKTGIDDWIAAAGTQGMDYIAASIKRAFKNEADRIRALTNGGCIALGFTLGDNPGAGTYEVFSVRKNGIVSISSRDITNQSMLLHAYGEAYLYSMYPKHDKQGHLCGFDATRAGASMETACEDAGHWNQERRVNAGVWPIEGDESALIVNSSEGLWATDGRPVQRVEPLRGGNVYMSSRDLGVTPDTPMAAITDAQAVLEALKSFTWNDPRDAGMALGWIAAAFYCGGLKQRPMLYISGARGSGKSRFLNFARSLIGQFAVDKMEGTGLTEPGLRRMLGSSSLVTLIDEAEATDKPERLHEVLAYVRSSYEGGHTSKGSQVGAGVDRYVMRSMVALGAINPPAMNDAEQSRFIRLHMLKRRGDAASHEFLTNPAAARNIGQMLGARMLKNFAHFSHALSIARPLLGGSSMRYQDTIGTVVAASFVALHDTEPTEAAMRTHLNTLDISTQHARIVGTRSDITPLEWLLDNVVSVDVASRTSRIAIREIVIRASGETGHRVKPHIEALGRMGLRLAQPTGRPPETVVDPASGEMRVVMPAPVLLIDPARGELLKMFKESQWSGQNLKEVFITLVPGCSKKMLDNPVQIGGHKIRVLEVLLGDMVSFEEDAET